MTRFPSSPGSPVEETPGPHGTQQGAATTGQRRGDRARERSDLRGAAGNVAEQQLDPTAHRIEHRARSELPAACLGRSSRPGPIARLLARIFGPPSLAAFRTCARCHHPLIEDARAAGADGYFTLGIRTVCCGPSTATGSCLTLGWSVS